MTTPNVSDNANAADDSDELDSDDEELLAGLDRSLGLSSVTVNSSYIGVTDNSALDLARTYSF